MVKFGYGDEGNEHEGEEKEGRSGESIGVSLPIPNCETIQTNIELVIRYESSDNGNQ